jgi:hypothetical protein
MSNVFSPGGIDLTARNLAGYGTTWQNKITSRSQDTVFTNTDDKTREVCVTSNGLQVISASVSSDGVNFRYVGTNGALYETVYFRVFPGEYYKVTTHGDGIGAWEERGV